MIISLPFVRRKIKLLFTSKVDFIWFDNQQNSALSSLLSPFSIFRLDVRQYLYLSPLSLLLSLSFFPTLRKVVILYLVYPTT